MLFLPSTINKIPTIYELIGDNNLREFIITLLSDSVNLLKEENKNLLNSIDKKDVSIFDKNFDIKTFLDRVDFLKETLYELLDIFSNDKELKLIIDELLTQ